MVKSESEGVLRCYRAHWIKTSSGEMKNILLTSIDVSSGTGVGNRVGSALFSYLTDIVGAAFLSRLLHIVTDNVSDACAAVNRLFQLVNSQLGSRVMVPSNHIRMLCPDHSVQRGVISILSQVKQINEELSRSTGHHPPKPSAAPVLSCGGRSIWICK